MLFLCDLCDVVSIMYTYVCLDIYWIQEFLGLVISFVKLGMLAKQCVVIQSQNMQVGKYFLFYYLFDRKNVHFFLCNLSLFMNFHSPFSICANIPALFKKKKKMFASYFYFLELFTMKVIVLCMPVACIITYTYIYMTSFYYNMYIYIYKRIYIYLCIW